MNIIKETSISMKNDDIKNQLINEICDILKVLPNLEQRIKIEKIIEKNIKKYE